MRLIGISGWSGSGKTTLLALLVPLFRARNLTVSTVKHTHHAFEIDTPGKDSWIHRRAGAHEVLVASESRFALIRELGDDPEPGLSDLLARMSPVDLVLIEGFAGDPHPKIEVHRPELGKPLRATTDPSIIAVASSARPQDITVPWLALDAPEKIADFILTAAVRRE